MTHLMSISARIAVGGLGLLLPVAGLAQTSTPTINGIIQDTWRVSNKLTFNWGLRFDHTLIPVYGNAKDNNDEVGDMDLVFGRYILKPAYLTNLVRGLILRQGKPWRNISPLHIGHHWRKGMECQTTLQ